MGVSSSESHDLTAFYELLTASFGVLSQNTGFYPSLDRIVETMLGPLNLGPRGRSYNEPISHLHQRKLATLHQGNSSVEELIQEFEIHRPISGLGNIGLVDCFEQVIHPCLQESIYRLEPMPTTWAEWKCKTSLLDNQWR